jgi:ribonuclease HII
LQNSMPITGWEYETSLLESKGSNVGVIAGVDEVGRGPLAGPVVAAAVILPASLIDSTATWLEDVRDSKQVSPKRRAAVCIHIHQHAVSVGIGAASSSEIDTIGIAPATRRAMERAIECLDPQPTHLLIDAMKLPAIDIPQTSIIKGDSLSKSIAAASIVAKEDRDTLMRDVLDARYPGYGFAGHKGYGSKTHMEAIERLGPCPVHRRSFAPIRQMVAGESA